MTSSAFEFLAGKLNMNITNLIIDTVGGDRKYWHGYMGEKEYVHGKYGDVLKEVKNFPYFKCRRPDGEIREPNKDMVTYNQHEWRAAPDKYDIGKIPGMSYIIESFRNERKYAPIEKKIIIVAGDTTVHYPKIYSCTNKCRQHARGHYWQKVAGGWAYKTSVEAQVQLAKISLLVDGVDQNGEDDMIDITWIPIIRYRIRDRFEIITKEEATKRLERFGLIPKSRRRRG